MNEKKPSGFNKAENKAVRILKDENKLKKLLKSALKKAFGQKEKLKSVWDDFQTLFRLINAWAKKEYKTVPWKTILYATTAVIYFLNPFDVVPDFIPIGGFVDDIGLITFVIKSIKKDLEKFLDWEKSKSDD